jgi:hypothetical protein
MTLRDLRGFQELMFRAEVRNRMFLAALPYHMAQRSSRYTQPSNRWR